MRFYYVSIISVLLLVFIWVVGTVLLAWFASHLRKTRKRVWPMMVPLFLILYIGPVAEELLIARNFDRMCKQDAGIFVYKTVEVDGFYNANGATLDLVRPGNYKFIEADDEDGEGTKRLEFGDEQWRRAAIARYEAQNPGKSAADRDYIRVDMDEQTRALVYPTQGDSWRITKLEQPTARYHYRKDDGVGIFYKVYRQSSKVEDSQSQEVLASYKRYSRKAPWFFIGLSDPGLGCDGPSGGPETGHSFLIYRDVLIPTGGANK
jgi:hypothetical protein